jgi:hypothetical protein
MAIRSRTSGDHCGLINYEHLAKQDPANSKSTNRETGCHQGSSTWPKIRNQVQWLEICSTMFRSTLLRVGKAIAGFQKSGQNRPAAGLPRRLVPPCFLTQHMQVRQDIRYLIFLYFSHWLTEQCSSLEPCKSWWLYPTIWTTPQFLYSLFAASPRFTTETTCSVNAVRSQGNCVHPIFTIIGQLLIVLVGSLIAP